MEDHLSHFVPRVCEMGYAWQDDIDGTPVLAARQHIFEARYRSYDPAKETALWREFAVIKPTREGFARFAGKWGHLVGRTFNFAGDLITGDSLETWTDAHKVIAHLFRLLSAIRSRDGLRRFLKPGKGGQYQYSFGRSGTWITAASDVEAGWRALQWTLNSHLQDAVVKRLLWDAELQRLSLHDVPRHLWGHMLYQFARAVDGEKQYRQCAECSRWFEVGAPGASRRDRIYCSGACRARVFRRNKEA